MHILRLECSAEDKDRLIAELWERGTLGIVEEDVPGLHSVLKAFFEAPFDNSRWAAHAPEWEAADDRDWVAESRSLWEPLVVGSRFFLVPAWRSDPTPPGRIRIEMQPSRAYGTGWGEPTQLALETVERRVAPGTTVLDLGTGTGILALAAVRLGAGKVFACDIDPDATAIARERFESERVKVGLFRGSIRSVRDRSIDFLVANINAETIVSLASEIRRVLAPGAWAAFTGFPDEHLDRVRAAFPGSGEVFEKAGWRAVVWQAC